MNRGELRTLTLSTLDDLLGGYFTEAQVNVWLNNAQKEVQKRLIKAANNYYTRFVQTNLVLNQKNYALPEDFKKEHRLEIVISGTCPNENVVPIIPITVNQQDLIRNGNGVPYGYFFSRNNLVLDPPPDQAYVMRLLYSYQVTDMVLDTDTPDVPDAYHELIALLAAQDGFLKDGRASELLVKKIADYQSDMDTDAQERNQDMPRSVVQTGIDNPGPWYY